MIPIHEKFVPEAFKEFGVSIDDFDVKTVTSVDVSSGKGIDAAGLTHTTSYLYPEAGCEYGKDQRLLIPQRMAHRRHLGKIGKIVRVEVITKTMKTV